MDQVITIKAQDLIVGQDFKLPRQRKWRNIYRKFSPQNDKIVFVLQDCKQIVLAPTDIVVVKEVHGDERIKELLMILFKTCYEFSTDKDSKYLFYFDYAAQVNWVDIRVAEKNDYLNSLWENQVVLDTIKKTHLEIITELSQLIENCKKLAS